jgi:hypothetical protein
MDTEIKDSGHWLKLAEAVDENERWGLIDENCN